MSLTEQVLSQVPGTALHGLRSADRLWQSYRDKTLPVATVVHESADLLAQVDWDVVICGGTLGIILGTTLAQQGWRVVLIERGKLRGRDQEWNISRHELRVLVELGLLTPAELEQAIATEYNPARIGFHKGIELWVEDVLNIGVDPVFLLDTLKAKFLQAGGQLEEQTAFKEVTVHANGVSVSLQSAQDSYSRTARLLLDAMGHFSPVSRQARQGRSPDAVCLVVGTCAQGFPENHTGDLFASFTPTQDHCQYFWEAFPARDGRTTYMFTYIDAHPDRPSLESFFETYLRLLPDYQGVELTQLQVQRALYGFFPCYRQPLQAVWPRILPIGDSSGSQSPLSFGGFGALIRHLRRLSRGLDHALTVDLLDRHALSLLQPYQPNLAVTWLFQRSMSVRLDQSIDPDQINALLSAVFQEMEQLGDPVLKPFLQDVVQFSALLQAMLRVSIVRPDLVLRVIPHVGVPLLVEWMVHYINLGLYTGLDAIGHRVALPFLAATPQYYYQRWRDAWQYGAGKDYDRG